MEASATTHEPHPITRQLAPFRAHNEIDYPMTMALRRRIFSHEGSPWEIVEVFTGGELAAVRLPRRLDWLGAEVYFFPHSVLAGELADARDGEW